MRLTLANSVNAVAPACLEQAVNPAAPYLDVKNVSKTFGGFKALTDVSFSAKKGDFVCLLGPSGCGKTTLLRCIGGLETTSSGAIIQNGVDITSLPPKRRDFGIVFQSYALFPNLTAKENVAFGLRNLRVPPEKARDRVNELFELIGLKGSEDKFPAQMSGGQQQRVALARALAMSPGLLLLDEPLSALDAQVRIRLRREIRRLQRILNVTTIMVTHDQEEALTMADKIVVLNEGRVEQVASGLELYQRPGSSFVAGFVGAMNFLQVGNAGPGKFRVCDETFSVPIPEASDVAGASAKIGFRPAEANLVSGIQEAEIHVSTIVQSIEFQGSHFRLITITSDESKQVIQVDVPVETLKAREIAEGQALTIFVPAKKLLIFGAS
jgi:iron(III) transport system ATP-binding protein